MMGDTDVDVIEQIAGQLGGNARLIEFGPWLGGVTAVLAKYGECHVVDRFEWSDLNAERLPGLLSPGDNFRPEFERFMEESETQVVIHECAFRDFEWSGGAIDFCLIDAPRTGKDLLDCLRPISKALTKDARVLIKHGANAERFTFMADIYRLLAEGYFKLENVGQPKWCNLAVLRPTSKTAALGTLDWSTDDRPTQICNDDLPDPWGGRMFLAALYATVIERDGYHAAYALLHEQIPNRDLLRDWDVIDRSLASLGYDPTELAQFAAVLDAHNDVPGVPPRTMDPHQSFPTALRYCWLSLADNPKRPDLFQTDAIAAAYLTGAFSVVHQLGQNLQGKDVALIGDRLNHIEIAVMASGARSFLGLSVTKDSKSLRPSFGSGAIASTIVPLTAADIYIREHFDVIGLLSNFAMTIELDQRIEDIIALKASKSQILRATVEPVSLPVLS
ncbi:hypothetical protein FTO60_10000 [Octadecabacter sp. SW4]|uniref:hypothetical protein n=1 Tax=Octadecabacter sp. SW4 TaxID=2602067 RepID=UPI0011C1F5DE|nr:hypothetical protein [Octadecabacter sp. SW4]QEE36014.1 hypothetical protein FTO60_10000 [Octadecabacter sp. SW4]